MKNSEKFKTVLLIILLSIFLYSIGSSASIVVVFITILIIYLILNWIVWQMFPEKLYKESNLNLYIESVEEYIKDADIEYITITYWWCRFMYYLDYELNKQPNEKNK